MIRFDPTRNYVNTPEKLEALSGILHNAKNEGRYLLAFDTETNGLLFFRNVVIGVSISLGPGEGFYIPFLEWHPSGTKVKRKRNKQDLELYLEGRFVDPWTGAEYPEDVTPAQYHPRQELVQFLTEWLPEFQLLMHNAPFDCCMVQYNLGLDLSQQLACDTILLKHAINENPPHGLKEIAVAWADELGFDAELDAAAEQRELGHSVLVNGGTWNSETKHVWRGDPLAVAKYAAADTALTFGVFEVGLEKFQAEYPPAMLDWFFQEEVMPVCKEVVIPMLYGGMYIDVGHFERLRVETERELIRLEDEAMALIKPHLDGFDIGQSIDDAVSEKRVIKAIMELEGLAHPTMKNRDGTTKPSLSKYAIQNAYEQDPHWFWAFLLGQGELRYPPEQVATLKAKLYTEVTGKRYHFNISSPMHLRWLLFTKLGNDPKSVPRTESSFKDKPIPSVDAEVLRDFFQAKYDFIRPILKHRKLSKMLGSYIMPALTLNHDGWLHMDMKQHGTTSGRFSCSGGFNLQTLPKVEDLSRCPKCESKEVTIEYPVTLLANLTCAKCGYHETDVLCTSVIKAGFVAPPGFKIINADFASLEPRCFAFESGDPKLKAVYRENLDLYSKVYCDMLDPRFERYSADPKSPKFLKKLNPKARDQIKPVVLGIPYGAQDAQVANLMGLKVTKLVWDKELKREVKKEVLDVEKGKEYRDLYLKTYAKLNDYINARHHEATTRGYVETLVGRRRHYRYAPFVADLLKEYRISQHRFLTAWERDLTGEYALQILGPAELHAFADQFSLKYWEVVQKGGWAYVRGVFKNELNNSTNAPIQGLAGHITNLSMLDNARGFRQAGIVGYVALQVHDEISAYARVDQAEQGKVILKRSMEENRYAKLVDIPMVAEPVICDSLKDSK